MGTKFENNLIRRRKSFAQLSCVAKAERIVKRRGYEGFASSGEMDQ